VYLHRTLDQTVNQSSFFPVVRSALFSLTAAIALSLGSSPDRVNATSLFNANEIDNPEDFALIAAPVGQTNRRQLLIVEQLASTRACWGETPGTPTEIQPLLLSFDFSGICGRMSDSNAYSVRIAGEDLGLQYALRIRERTEGAVLVATPLRYNSDLPELEIGRAYGSADGFVKIYLDPAWRLARRSYQGRTLGHVYLMSDYSIDELSYMASDMSAPTATLEPTEPTNPEVPLDVPAWGEPSTQPTQTAQPTRPVRPVRR
jgi:hypothetical protein